MLSAAIPAKALPESTSQCRRQLKVWLELGKHGPCKYRPALPSVISKYASQCGAAEERQHFFEEAGSKAMRLMHFNKFSSCQCAQ